MNTYAKDISFLKALTFLHFGGKAIILPFLPLFLLTKGFSMVEIGTIMGVAPLISIVAQPFVGFISDKYKTVKIVLILLYIGVAAASFGVFFHHSFWVVFISFLLFHFALSPATPLIDSLTLKTLGTKKHEYGKIRLWGSFGFFCIALISGPILQRIQIERLYLPFLIMTAFTVFVLLFLKDRTSSTTPVNLRSVGEVLKNRFFITFLLLCLLVLIPHRINDMLIVIHLESLGATTFWVGLAWGWAALSEVPVFYFLAKKVNDHNELLLLSIVAFLYTVRWGMYSLITSPYILSILQISHGLTFGLFWLIAMQMAVRSIPEHLRSTGQALLTSVCFGVGGAIGGTGGGWILEQVGSFSLYRYMAGMTFIATILIFLFYRYTQRENLVQKRTRAFES
ncbi:MFS transporter [Litchfieldia alkalitelluris]|uniref:MFS transporter n=1 Tax=Litchfieldia alkalitelluris TaxID=304268 RepID=UPI0009960A66|nr:MFS transporter [Litchfieldia alkalitelluris]